MQTLNKPSWFTSASRSLELIEENIGDFENDERIAPTPEVIQAVREFLKVLDGQVSTDFNITEPKLFVSPNGHIVATLGSRPKTLNVRFTPETTFLFKDPDLGTSKGKGLDAAIKLVVEHFQTR